MHRQSDALPSADRHPLLAKPVLAPIFAVAGEKQVADAMTPADSVASPDALNGVVLTDSKPQKQVEASASDQPTEDVVMGEAQKPELDTAAAAAPAGVKQEDAPARIPDTTSTPAADGVDTTEPLQQQNGQLSPSANDAPVVTAKQLHADAPAEPAEEAGANDAQ